MNNYAFLAIHYAILQLASLYEAFVEFLMTEGY